MKRKAKLLILGVLGYTGVICQPTTNINPVAAPININLPRTPESAGFEKYGNIPVNELTGTPNISIPLYSVKGKFLEAPMSVTYDASGIKVSQEASWIGLGFNLQVGGRITVETRGCIDNHPVTRGLFTPQALAYGMQKLFTRLGNGNNAGILTFASTCYQCDTADTHDIPDDWSSINAMAQFGLGEPDIFHANFAGYSFSYFYDKITGLLRFIGEKNHFQISYNTDQFDRIISWRVVDNQGVTYRFNQQEITSTDLPSMGTLYGNSSTTGWLLTSMVHPTGDSIVFSYTNYGKSYPAFTRNASLSFDNPDPNYTLSQDGVQDSISQEPAYLTRIESNTTVVDFVLSGRDDIRGNGSKKLDTIRVRDRQTGTVKKKISFGYSYFTSSGLCYNTLPDSVSKYFKRRLKLNELTINDTASLGSPYQFYYFNDNGMPDKYSYSQDHWGYLNTGGTTFDECTPKGLIPTIGLGNDLSYSTVASIGKNRDCTPYLMATLTMDSIVYPSGGSTKLIYEPHYSQKANPFMQPAGTVNGVTMISLSYTTPYITGGGQRIKTMRNYALGRLTGTLEYSYGSGLYMGAIRYNTSSLRLSASQTRYQDVLSINGAFNDNDFLVGYRGVSVKQIDASGASLGYISKGFKITPIYYIGNNGLGFEVQAAHWPGDGTYCLNGSCTTHTNSLLSLVPPYTSNAPTPAKGLDGKLMTENYYDPSNQLTKSVEYFYSLKDYSQDFYSVRAKDNLDGTDQTVNFNTAGARRYTVFVSPAKSYFTVTDSVVEKTYSGSDFIKVKKAYKYNEYYQQVGEIIYNSDGTQNISLTKTSMEMEPPHYPISPAGDAALLSSMKSANIYDLPIEQMQLKRTSAGDTLLLQSRFNIYQGNLPLRVYGLEATRPLGYKTEFIPTYFTYPNAPNYPSGGNYTLVMDSRYKLYSAADYSSASQLKGLHNLAGNSAYIWDEHYNTILAQCTDADSSSVAYSSFETNAMGRWSYDPAAITADITAPTGSRRYTLSTADITLTGLNMAKTYIVSFWKKTGSQSVNSKAGIEGKALNGWTYVEYKITGASSVTVSGSGYIDELRLYPAGSQMTTYTYEPLIGLSAQADPASRISYYEYDVIGRLTKIKDQDRNLVRLISYKQKDIFTYPYANTEQTQAFTRTCDPGYISSTLYYTVPANKYGSLISVPDANAKAVVEITANGPAVQAQCTCLPYYSFSTCCGWGGVNSHFELTGTGSVNFSLVLNKNNSIAYGQIGTLTGILFLPSVDRFVTVSSQGQSYTLVFRTTGVVEIMGPNFTNLLQLSGSYNL
ncbi:MAG: hypothetical protein J0I32_24260 [Sphingobacteriales bacterium]|mgnify:CR=1 FL=1|nr:hypothetical protein [Sphingobacteriales bacterium]OJW04443.1 MAG: hypothetical protein BGO52_18090 [Sphingobacteriales bacterium 44-61]